MFSKVFNFAKNNAQLNLKLRQFFDLHEYQSKDLMRSYGVRVQRGGLALNAQEAKEIASQYSNKGGLILKAQVHAGGRGKGKFTSGLKGGVQVLNTPDQVYEKTQQMIGYNLITHQTPKNGLKTDAVYVVEGINIDRQIYLAYILDRSSQLPAIVASKKGGMDIEEVAKTEPSAIFVKQFDPVKGITDEDCDAVINALDLQSQRQDARSQLKALYKLFCSLDCTQVEINPWATNEESVLYCVDAKINIDDNAKFRQTDVVKLRKSSKASEEVDPHEEKAQAAGLSYVALDGNIGCLVNGAGLAMSTMDIIKLAGGAPANFLDVGGGADVDQVKTAFEILSSHPKVNTILINIFGGILSCKTIAEGIIKAAQLVDLRVPLVIRLAGNASDLGAKLLEEYAKKNPKFKARIAHDLGDAAVKAVQTAKEFTSSR